MRITDKDTADDVKYHLQRENPPEPTRAQDCTDFFTLADGSRLCKHNEGHLHCLCENMIRFKECPKGIREM
jgi:hypothetical protein